MTQELSFELAGGPYAVTAARLALADTESRLEPSVAFDLRLLVSELVTNSVKYGGEGPVELHLDARGETIHAEIVDSGGGFEPKARDRELDDPGGWGLHLVEELTDRWGTYEGSTHVWFEMDVGGAA